MPEVKLCRECKYSEAGADMTVRCVHPEVNKKDPWVLSSFIRGSSAKDERTRQWYGAPCGMKGKLWEPREALQYAADRRESSHN
jgi:hypothetical protein